MGLAVEAPANVPGGRRLESALHRDAIAEPLWRMVRSRVRLSPIHRCANCGDRRRQLWIRRIFILAARTCGQRLLEISRAVGAGTHCDHFCLSRRSAAILPDHFSLAPGSITARILADAHALETRRRQRADLAALHRNSGSD